MIGSGLQEEEGAVPTVVVEVEVEAAAVELREQ